MEKKIRCRATFLGATWMPWWAVISTNNANPQFIIFENRLEVKILSRISISFDEIKTINVRTLYKTNNIYFKRQNSLFIPIANIRKKEDLIEVLNILREKGVKLSGRAMKLWEEHQ